MQQRPTSSSRAPEENCVIKVTLPIQQAAKYSPRSSKMDESAQLPVYKRDNKDITYSRFASEKLVHAIPALVLLCLFTLWWFSYPVNLEMKDGKIMAIHRVEMPEPVDNNHVELAILASARSPVASVPQNATAANNEMEAHPVSKTG
ncbi:hypothetical protein JCGZ_05613 [Jatropha curcas]|uniref:Uncharacterized protein n=1 Tax=Jatropha curcas TaxID=180498 RepID=A0A067L6Q6_JATCU|nr:uncharacterized protein LOC105628342 [Jatropha curcas]KDP44146.1 hypothetical protein JCGZ_05613 [Jatropha curcas]